MLNDSIKKWMLPENRYLFINREGITEVLRIREVSETSLTVCGVEAFKSQTRLKGFMPAGNGRGIVQVEGEVEALGPHHALPFHLFKLHVTPDSLAVIDRRHFHRHELVNPLPVTFQADETPLLASLSNISSGGMRLLSAVALPLQHAYQFEMKLNGPRTGHLFEFRTDGMIIYSEWDPNARVFATGIAFILDRLASPDARSRYTHHMELFRDFLENEFGM